MVFGIIIGRGTLPFIQGPAKVKINKEYYYLLYTLAVVPVYLLCLCKKEMNKVYFHHDMTPSSTAAISFEYLAKLRSEIGISYLE